MSQQAVQIYKLREEADRLRDRLERLQLQLESEASVAPVVSATATSTADPGDVWNVWPYCWAGNGLEAAGSFCRERLHSFHENRVYRTLCRENRKRSAPQWGADVIGPETLRLV